MLIVGYIWEFIVTQCSHLCIALHGSRRLMWLEWWVYVTSIFWSTATTWSLQMAVPPMFTSIIHMGFSCMFPGYSGPIMSVVYWPQDACSRHVKSAHVVISRFKNKMVSLDGYGVNTVVWHCSRPPACLTSPTAVCATPWQWNASRVTNPFVKGIHRLPV